MLFRKPVDTSPPADVYTPSMMAFFNGDHDRYCSDRVGYPHRSPSPQHSPPPPPVPPHAVVAALNSSSEEEDDDEELTFGGPFEERLSRPSRQLQYEQQQQPIVRWSPPLNSITTRHRHAGVSPFRGSASQTHIDQPPFHHHHHHTPSRFLSASPPLTENRQNNSALVSSKAQNYSCQNIHQNSALIRSSSSVFHDLADSTNKGNDDLLLRRVERKKLLISMDSSYNNNDDFSTTRGGSSSIQPYNTKREEMGSPGETRRDFNVMRQGSGNVPVMAIPTSGYAMAPQPSGKMLVDPATGQQYFVPTAHPQPQVAYYPVFYNSHPVSSAQPVYYQPTAHPGYFMGPPQPVPTSPTHSGSGMKHQIFFQSGHDSHHQQQQYAQHPQNSPPLSVPQMAQHPNYKNMASNPPTAAYVELPPSSAVSLCETNSVTSSSPYFQRHHESRVSTESAGSNSTKQSDDSFSQAQHQRQHIHAGSSSPQHQKLYVDPRIQNFSARHSSATSTSSTSGFNSAGTESGTANSKSVLSAHSSGGGNDGPTPTTRNLFYTSPSAWWGDIAEDNNNEVTGKKMEHDCSASPRSRPSIGSVKESLQQPEQSVSSPVKVTQKAIRMDIDLNQPMVVEATQSKVSANRTPPTAFTVTFDDSDDVEGSRAASAAVKKTKPPVSLQDAARQAPTGRRLMRRAGGGQTESSSKQQSDGGGVQDPKQYLFSKMFQGYDRGGGHMSTSNTFSYTDDEKRNESDAMSEAGTYIIERQAGQGMITSQILDDSGAESDSSSASSTVSDSATQHTSSANNERQLTPAVRPTTILMPMKKPLQATGAPSSPSKTPVLARRSLMSDLKKLREETTGGQQPPGGVSPSSPRRSLGGAQNTPRAAVSVTSPRVGGSGVAPRPTFSLRPCQQNQQARLSPNSTNVSGSGGNTFRPSPRCHSETRADGGRFSMRSSAATSGASTARMVAAGGSGSRLNGKPPFRIGSGGGFAKPSSAKLGVTQKESPEMIAWLRRKEYDPRKAANEARQMQQLKQRLLKLATGGVSMCDENVDSDDPFGGEDLENNKRRSEGKIVRTSKPARRLKDDAFIANRSISYHNAGAGNSAFRQWSKKPVIRDERSNKSHDDLSRLGEEAEEFAQLTLAESSSSLKRTVDELTQKCHKSIELIRLSKKNSLSPSVENLLESVVESSTLIGAEREAAAQNTAGRRGSGGAGSSGGEEPAENISNRLERLSSAFDAIQKYLEESTTSTSGNNQSPTSGGISKTIAAKPKVFSSGSSTQKLLEDLCRLDNRHHQAADEAVQGAPHTSRSSEVDAASDASSAY